MTKIALVFVLVFTPALVEAQACAPGRVVGDATAGHCCWPGQSWSDGAAHCTGVPSCPAGFGGDGAECVSLAVPSVGVLPYRPDAGPPIRFERQPNYAVIGGGTGLFVATYLSSLVLGLTQFVPCSNSPGIIPFLIPFGSFATLACHDAEAATIGVAFGLGQLIGFVLMALGNTVFQLNVRATDPAVSLGRDGLTLSF